MHDGAVFSDIDVLAFAHLGAALFDPGGVREIVLPLGTRVMLPSWIGLTLGVMKDTALVLWIGIIELLRSSQIIVTRIQEPLFVLSIAGLIYFLMSYPVARLGDRLEKKWREND